MASREPHFPPEEFDRRADATYERIRGQVEQANRGRILAIDVESGEFEIADDEQAACDALLTRLPDAQIYCLRIGFPGIIRLGSRAMFGKLQ